jgi:hypothetical protein
MTSGETSKFGDEPEWHDLAKNRPGQSARHKAIELRQAAPVKSILAHVLGVQRDERHWRVGADGEEEVAWRLRKLGEGWRVLHAVPVGQKGADIDHVVIGPPGVFTLNTKNHKGNRVNVNEKCVYVNGQWTDYLRNSRHEVQRASRLLTAASGSAVDVVGVIVVIAAQFTVKSEPPDVRIVGRKSVAKWLASLPTVLAPERVEAIYRYARRDSTWRSGGRAD